MYFNNIKDLNNYLIQTIAKVIKDDVSVKIKELESANVEEFVYNSYKPVMYDRRKDNGGLSDVDNMSHTVNISGNSVELTVDNNTMSNPDFMPRYGTPHKIASEVEYGYGYDYSNGDEPFATPRPFVEQTRLELEHGKAKELLKKGLAKQGIKTI